jgi:hypothetical protein
MPFGVANGFAAADAEPDCRLSNGVHVGELSVCFTFA